MRSLVIDTNIVFSALVSKRSDIRDILLNQNNILFAPNYLFTEIFIKKERIFKFTKLNEIEFYKFFNVIIERINFVPLEIISKDSKIKAKSLCEIVDKKDIIFVALAIELDSEFMTGDEKLKRELRKKGFQKLFIY